MSHPQLNSFELENRLEMINKIERLKEKIKTIGKKQTQSDHDKLLMNDYNKELEMLDNRLKTSNIHRKPLQSIQPRSGPVDDDDDALSPWNFEEVGEEVGKAYNLRGGKTKHRKHKKTNKKRKTNKRRKSYRKRY